MKNTCILKVIGEDIRSFPILQLYNALNGTDYQNVKDLQINTLEEVVYMGYKNDLSFLIGNTLNLYEHQSTVNPNMSIRGLIYLSALYEGYIAEQESDIYGSKLIKLPFPRYIVFYNGEKEMPERQELHLSDAYIKTAGIETDHIEPCLELTVTVLNINVGHNKEILEKCRKLKEYTLFVEKVRNNLNSRMDASEALEQAITYCIENDILKDILLKNRAEVTMELLTKFDEKKYLDNRCAEAREDGQAEATSRINSLHAHLLKEGKLEELERSVSDIAYQQELFLKYNIK